VRLAAVLSIAFLAGLATVAPVADAKRTVPHGFFGANWGFQVAKSSSPATQDSTWGRMAKTGIESQRLTFVWARAQHDRDSLIDFTATDASVKLAVSHGMELLPVVAFGARWARQGDDPNSPPSDNAAYADYLKALIARYGPKGVFWDQHPELPRKPIRAWQVWNEPSANYQWTIPKGTDWAPGYGKLLRVSYRAIKDADPGARVVLAGLANLSDKDLEHLYKKGKIHGAFDVSALHPYTAQPGGVLTLVKRFKAVMKKHGDGKKQLWVTELGLPASKGKFDDPSPLQTDDAGMAKFLTRAYGDLIANRRWEGLGVTRMYWFTWASAYKASGGWIFDWSGLLKYTRKKGKDVFGTKPALAAYRKVAQSAEGCAKTAAGACARRRG
jgi:hypothetical protein